MTRILWYPNERLLAFTRNGKDGQKIAILKDDEHWKRTSRYSVTITGPGFTRIVDLKKGTIKSNETV